MLLYLTHIQIHTARNTVKVFSMSASEMMPALMRLRRTFWICFLSPGINEWRRSNITTSSGPSSDGLQVFDIAFSQMSASFLELNAPECKADSTSTWQFPSNPSTGFKSSFLRRPATTFQGNKEHLRIIIIQTC